MTDVLTWRPSVVRRINRFVLDVQTGIRGDHDLVDSLILIFITQANVARIIGSPEFQRDYAGPGQLPPDSVRRPVSISSVAAGLRLPFETARRRIQRLVADDWCRIARDGVYVPAERLASPQHEAALADNYRTVQELYRDLRALGFAPQRGRRPPPASAGPPVRAVARLVGEYYLRIAELWAARPAGVAGGFVLMAVFEANTAAADPDNDQVIEDSQRIPARAPQVVARLRFEPEFVRRRLLALVRSGVLVRVDRGFVIPRAVLLEPHVVERLSQSSHWLGRMFDGLSEGGFLQALERPGPA